jgi:hypothetical protein
MVSPGLSHIAKITFHKIAFERNFRTILQPSNTKLKKKESPLPTVCFLQSKD